MKRLNFCTLACLFAGWFLQAQPAPGAYKAVEKHGDTTRNYLMLISDEYIIHTVYESDPARFISTMGGFYSTDGDSLRVALEFNSDYPETREKNHHVQYGYADGKLIINGNDARGYKKQPELEQPLDGAWLFATRGPDTGQDRRGDDSARKTLKFLTDGYFQWIAYNSETLDFMGTGGGRYAAEDGTYTEVIRFFSRDDSRVGAELNFEFDRQETDWHHTGQNSRGEPMYEIWSLR